MGREEAIHELVKERAHSTELEKRVKQLQGQLAKLQRVKDECQAKRLTRVCVKVRTVPKFGSLSKAAQSLVAETPPHSNL